MICESMRVGQNTETSTEVHCLGVSIMSEANLKSEFYSRMSLELIV